MKKNIAALVVGIALSCGTTAGVAGVFGPLANFDVVNDTGKNAHGFEIDIDDIRQTEITSLFGAANRWPNMERYGAPTVTEYASATATRTGRSVKIVYQATLNGSTWSSGTPSGTLPVNPSDSCWPYGAPTYGPNYPCDHFGVSTTVNTPVVNYSWLVETSPGATTLTPVAATVPNPVWTVIPVPPVNNQPQPPQVHVAIVAPQPVNFNEFGEPRWVKVTATGTLQDVAVEDLVAENAIIQKAKTQVQVEWQLLQVDNQSPGSGQIDLTGVALDQGAMGVVYRFEYYQYIGVRDPATNEALPINGDTTKPAAADLGKFIVAQNAGINFDGNIPAAPPLPIAPSLNASITDAVINKPYSQQIKATPGNAGDVLQYQVTGLPAGLSVDLNTGIIGGIATTLGGPYTLTITVKDTTNATSISGSTVMSVVDGAITFTLPATLPGGNIGSLYSYSMAATGGTGSFTYSTVNTLPGGLSLTAATGLIGGTPTTLGTSALTFTAKDSAGFSTNASTSITIGAGNPPPVACSGTNTVISNVVLGGTTVDVNGGMNNGGQTVAYAPVNATTYKAPLTAATGFAAGNLLTFNGTADATGICHASTMTLSLGLTVGTVSFPLETVGVAIAPVTFAISGGIKSYTVVASGMPKGIVFNATTHTFSGKPLAVGTFPISVSVSDSNGRTVNQTVNMDVGTTFALPTITLPNAQVGVPYSSGVIVPTGGVAPYIITGTGLPLGLAIKSSAIVGTPRLGQQGLHTVTITAKDKIAETLTKTATLMVNPPVAIVLGVASLPTTGTVGAAYSGLGAATGGVGTLTWTATGLPTGAVISPAGVISGTLTKAGTFKVVLTVKDSIGQKATVAATVKVL